jgi:hypothetical protein
VYVVKAYLLLAYLKVNSHSFIERVGIIKLTKMIDGIPAEDCQIEHLVLTGIFDGVRIIRESSFYTVPVHKIVMGAFLKADDVGMVAVNEIGR